MKKEGLQEEEEHARLVRQEESLPITNRKCPIGQVCFTENEYSKLLNNMKRYNLKATSGSRVKYLNITQFRKNLILFTDTNRPYATRVRIDENNDLRVVKIYKFFI